MQAAGAAFDTDHSGTVSASEAANAGRPLDRWNLGLIGASFPGFISGKAVHYCAPETFTSPVTSSGSSATPNAEYGCPDTGTDATAVGSRPPPGRRPRRTCARPASPPRPAPASTPTRSRSRWSPSPSTSSRPSSPASPSGDVGGAVPATLSLTLGTPAAFGAFTPGMAKEYTASTTANVISTAGDATLSVADPSSNATGRLVNGAFALPQAVQARANTGAYAPVGGSSSPTPLLTYTNPISNDVVTIGFKQSIAANDALRTGAYNKTLTLTLSTTMP